MNQFWILIWGALGFNLKLRLWFSALFGRLKFSLPEIQSSIWYSKNRHRKSHRIHLSPKSLRPESHLHLSWPPQLSTQSELIRSWQTSLSFNFSDDGSLMILIHFCLETSERNDLSYSFTTTSTFMTIANSIHAICCQYIKRTFFASTLNH